MFDVFFLFCFFFNDFYFLFLLLLLSASFFFNKSNNFFLYQLIKLGYLFYFILVFFSFYFLISLLNLDFLLFFSNPIYFISTLTFYCFNGYLKINLGVVFFKLFFSFIFLFYFFPLFLDLSVIGFKTIILVLWGFFLLQFLLCVNHLFVFFLILEFLAVVTILLILLKGTARSVYLAILYFFLNIFFSSIFILSYTYFLIQNGNGFLDLFFFSGKNLLGCFFLFLFFLFKLGAVPFHAWSLDIYENVSLSIFIFLTVFYKLILFIVFLKFLFYLFYPFLFSSSLYIVLFISAILSILFGILSPIMETRLIRVFTFSSLYVFGFCLIFWLYTASDFVFFFFFFVFVFLLLFFYCYKFFSIK